MALTPQQQLQGGKYTIQRELGRGRFGITYLARDRDGNGYAIKTLNDRLLDNEADFDRWQQKFVQEAFKLSQCKHPHIVEAFEPFQEGQLWCIPMEYVNGTNLADRDQSRLPEEEALRYIQQIGEALMVVHGKGLVHRDVKPDNIIVRSGKPEAVLIDFGLARGFDHPLTQTRGEETAEGFTPPELYLTNGKPGAFTDVYSLAATLYALLTGQVPESGLERKHKDAPLVPPQEINDQISAIVNQAILKGMMLNVNERPQTVREWLKLLGLRPAERGIGISLLPDWSPAIRISAIGIVIALLSALATCVSSTVKVMEYFKDSPSSSPSQQGTPNQTVPPGQP